VYLLQERGDTAARSTSDITAAKFVIFAVVLLLLRSFTLVIDAMEFSPNEEIKHSDAMVIVIFAVSWEV